MGPGPPAFPQVGKYKYKYKLGGQEWDSGEGSVGAMSEGEVGLEGLYGERVREGWGAGLETDQTDQIQIMPAQ